MSDIIQGKVTNVVDGDTFDMTVTHIGTKNKEEYNDSERIRIAGIDKPEMNTEAGKKAKEVLKNKLDSKVVKVTVQARDTYSRIVGTYEIL